MKSDGYLLKRPFDIFLSLIGLMVSLPLWLLVGVAIWIDDRGPIFYFQKRVGRGGLHFYAYKFRTMVPESDKLFGPLQAMDDDHRITKVGKILRITAMDELPQLINILKGEMSFVGPRALLPAEIETGNHSSESAVPLQDIPGFWKRQSIRPGLTGLAQIYAVRNIARKQKFRLDLLYIGKESIWLDIKLIFISFWITFNGKWEAKRKRSGKSLFNVEILKNSETKKVT